MAQASATGGRSKNLVLTAMIFAVSMTFIDQTIVSIAVPEIQRELGLTSTGVQWAVNAYLLSVAALFALGGRLADTIGPRRMVTIGVIIFAGASTLCGLTPKGSLAEAWLIVLRVIQGAGGAVMFPAALAIVVQTFPLRERGKALAAFFGIAGGLTALGPLLGGFLTEWTWRAIFWVNIPVAIVALILIAWSKPVSVHQPARLDYRCSLLIAAGIALSVLGFQQSQVWGWTNPATGLCIAAGLGLLVVFYVVEIRTPSPLMQMSMFRIRPFLVENIVLGVATLAFVPVFFFAKPVRAAGAGPVVLAGEPVPAVLLHRVRRGGADRRPDAGPDRRQAAGGPGLRAGRGRLLALGREGDRPQLWYVILAGGGMGLMLGPASTDAVNRAWRYSYGEATGITQTVRNYAASLGLAILGTLLVSQLRSQVTSSLTSRGVPATRGRPRGRRHLAVPGQNARSAASSPHFIRLDFAAASRTVFYAMAIFLAVAAIVALAGLRGGGQEQPGDPPGSPEVKARPRERTAPPRCRSGPWFLIWVWPGARRSQHAGDDRGGELLRALQRGEVTRAGQMGQPGVSVEITNPVGPGQHRRREGRARATEHGGGHRDPVRRRGAAVRRGNGPRIPPRPGTS